MTVVTIEEHWIAKDFASFFPRPGQPGHDTPIELLADVGESRIAEMDKGGIDLQVLGHCIIPTTAPLIAFQSTNDKAAGVCRKYPTRFAAFAILPVANAADAAAELERTVTNYGFKGAMINGTTDGQFLDHPRFEPLLDKAEKLGVPLYLHPGYPIPAINDAYYKGEFSDHIGRVLASTVGGWHWEVALHALRMIVSGVFDRHPNLQIVIGHLGETIPFFWERLQYFLEPRAKGFDLPGGKDSSVVLNAKKLDLPVCEYFFRNVYVTTSGFTTNPPFELALKVFGADRMIFSVDYPFSPIEPAMRFLRNLPVNEEVRAKISYGNASKLLNLN